MIFRAGVPQRWIKMESSEVTQVTLGTPGVSVVPTVRHTRRP